MNLSLKEKELTTYLSKQMNNFMPDTPNYAQSDLMKLMSKTIDRLEYCFSRINLPAFRDENNNILFNHLHTDQYCMFLYFLSNEAYTTGNRELYTRLSVLNRFLNGIDLFGHIKMPDIFLLVHPIGTVIGRANFKNYLCIYQGVTIGGTHTNEGIKYPTFDENINIFAHSKILGNCVINNNVTFGANTFIINKNILQNSIVTGNFPSNSIKTKLIQWSPFNIDNIQ